MAFPQGIAFRQNTAFVTDGANDDGEISQSANNYPRTTAQGNSVGWETNGTSISTRDRNAALDARLAGIAFCSGVTATYRIDLPATGSYNIRIAAGDNDSAQEVNVDLYDNTTSLGTLSSGSTSLSATFKDATNVQRTAAAWPGSNALVNKTFASTICRFKLNPGASGNPNTLAYVYVESAGGGTSGTVRRRRQRLSGTGPY